MKNNDGKPISKIFWFTCYSIVYSCILWYVIVLLNMSIIWDGFCISFNYDKFLREFHLIMSLSTCEKLNLIMKNAISKYYEFRIRILHTDREAYLSLEIYFEDFSFSITDFFSMEYFVMTRLWSIERFSTFFRSF